MKITRHQPPQIVRQIWLALNSNRQSQFATQLKYLPNAVAIKSRADYEDWIFYLSLCQNLEHFITADSKMVLISDKQIRILTQKFRHCFYRVCERHNLQRSDVLEQIFP